MGLAKTSHKKYLHGDFDKDGVPNIDDKYPFSKRKNEKVNPEVSLSTAFKRLDKKRMMAKKVAKRLSKKYKAKTRVKDTHSVVNKLLSKKMNTIGDFIGMRLETKTRKQARDKWKKFNNKNKKKIVEKENKYRTLSRKRNPYRAYHSNLILGEFGVEAQFRTKKYGKLNDEMHEAYKKGRLPSKFFKRARELRKKGY